MNEVLATVPAFLAKTGVFLVIANEVRGLIMAGPLFYTLLESGGSRVAVVVGISYLLGLLLSVVLPLFLLRKCGQRVRSRPLGAHPS